MIAVEVTVRFWALVAVGVTAVVIVVVALYLFSRRDQQ
jgi:hypothetical protein